MAKTIQPSRMAMFADFFRYQIYDRCVADYRKRMGKIVAEKVDAFRINFSLDMGSETLLVSLISREKAVAKYEVRTIGDSCRFKVKHIEDSD